MRCRSACRPRGANAGQIDITYDAFGQAGPTTEVLVDAVGYLVEGGGGATGPVGPAGPTGPPGPAGPVDGDGWGSPYARVGVVADIAGCPTGQIRLILSVTGEALYPDGPTACQPLTTDVLDSKMWFVSPVAGASLSSLYESAPLSNGDFLATIRPGFVGVDLGGGETVIGTVQCETQPDGQLFRQASGYRTRTGVGILAPATSSEWQQIIDVGLSNIVVGSQLLP
jgi:hypothetical protein